MFLGAPICLQAFFSLKSSCCLTVLLTGFSIFKHDVYI
jgi:hypothetical protein